MNFVEAFNKYLVETFRKCHQHSFILSVQFSTSSIFRVIVSAKSNAWCEEIKKSRLLRYIFSQSIYIKFVKIQYQA